MADRARQKTDNILNDLEQRIRDLYNSDPLLRSIQRKYVRYMDSVKKSTEDDYRAFEAEPYGDNRNRLKRVYKGHVEALTVKNKEYKSIISEFSKEMARVNQQALELVNDTMAEIYSINYNQIAVECKKVGIEVHGEKEEK